MAKRQGAGALHEADATFQRASRKGKSSLMFATNRYPSTIRWKMCFSISIMAVIVCALLLRPAPPELGEVTVTFRGYTNDATGSQRVCLVLSNQTSRDIIPFMYWDYRPGSTSRTPMNGIFPGSTYTNWLTVAAGKSIEFTIPRGAPTMSHQLKLYYPKHNWAFRLWMTQNSKNKWNISNRLIPEKWLRLELTSTTY
jgi:hypothetical protein